MHQSVDVAVRFNPAVVVIKWHETNTYWRLKTQLTACCRSRCTRNSVIVSIAVLVQIPLELVNLYNVKRNILEYRTLTGTPADMSFISVDLKFCHGVLYSLISERCQKWRLSSSTCPCLLETGARVKQQHTHLMIKVYQPSVVNHSTSQTGWFGWVSSVQIRCCWPIKRWMWRTVLYFFYNPLHSHSHAYS